LHVDGFHEARLRSVDVAKRYRYIEALINLAKRVMRERIQR
jgi:hypothetical protein